MVNFKGVVTITLECEEHNEKIVWSDDTNESFYDFLKRKLWGYDFQVKTIYYCPKCLKDMKAPAGRVDTRLYI